MLEYIGHGSGMWRSTGIATGDHKMIRVHGKLLCYVTVGMFAQCGLGSAKQRH